MQTVADRVIVRALKRIDKELEVRFVDPPGRWGVYHSLPNYGARLEDVVDAIARELQRDLAARGSIVPFSACQEDVFEGIQAAKLVCYVTNDDGSYRPLDGRIIEKLQRMDYYRQNLGIQGWKQMLNARASVQRKLREQAQTDADDSIRRDKVYARMLSDILWGLTPTRSVIVPAGVPTS